MEIKLGKYRHYKGKEYEVFGVGRHSETMEEFVIYKSLSGDRNIWVRPVKMFLEDVEILNKKIPRFDFIG